MSDSGSGEGVYGAAREAVNSAAEQVRAAAPEAYDAGIRAARYVGETASDHPVIVGMAVIAFLGGLLSATVGRRQDSRDWQGRVQNWRDQGYEIGDSVRSMAPDVSKTATDASKYVSQSVSESPMSGLLIAVAVGGVLGDLFRGRPYRFVRFVLGADRFRCDREKHREARG